MSSAAEPRLPIVIGIAGHRDLRAEDQEHLQALVKEHLQALMRSYPHSPFIVLSALAAGADQLCARVALELGCRLIVPLPLEIEDYRRDFNAESRAAFDDLLAQADSSLIVSPIEARPEEPVTRNFFYRQAGIYIAQHSHLLLALWDGVEQLYPEGGGTYETVDFMLHESWRRTDTYPFKAEGDGMVCHIVTPRQSNPQPLLEAFSGRILSTHGLVGERQQRGALSHTDCFNRDIQSHRQSIEKAQESAGVQLLGSDSLTELSPHSNQMLGLYAAADSLSLHFRDRRLRSLQALSLLGLLLVLCFLFYDELESDLMLPLYALGLVAAFSIYYSVTRREYHRKYLEYRMLAEGLRVQLYWQLVGVKHQVHEQYSWAQRSSSIWIKQAQAALDLGAGRSLATPAMQSQLKRYWIDGQGRYHRESFDRKGRNMRVNNHMTRLFLVLSLAVLLMVMALELGGKQWLSTELNMDALAGILLMHEGQDITWRGVIKILLGGLSAGTAFLANYYGKLSLPQQLRDNYKMGLLYAMAGEQYDQAIAAGDTAGADQILFALGREELVENGHWLLYNLDATPDLFI